MPQLSLYIDESTLKQIETAAGIENISISKFVVKKLNESMHNSWPENFSSLFGSINDETFKKPQGLNFSMDAQREKI